MSQEHTKTMQRFSFFSHLLLFFFFFFFFFFHLFCSSSADDTTAFVYAGCSQPKYAPNTPYQYNLNSLLASLANSASMSNFGNFTSDLASPSYPVYGLYQCRGDLPIPTCHSCVRAAITQLTPLCSSSSSASLQLRGCVVRYGNDTFLGQPDNTLLFRKCGPAMAASGYETDLVGMREGVLGGLLEGTGPYRVGRVGNVDGVAQCVGDQSEKECGECVAEAVAEMRNACGGPAVSSDVYLGKCYVVYSSRAVSPSSNHGHAQETGKEMAIIIGIAAAVLLLILLLYFLSKSKGGKGKF